MVRRQSPRSSSLKRRVGIRTPRRTFALFCEGERTEPEYLAALKRERDVRETAAVDLRIEAKGSKPLALVKLAIAAREKMLREEGEIDEFWCVFDVEWPENHPGLVEAVELAEASGIQLAISNPCFELWLILHFRDHAAFLNNDAARRLRRSCDNQSDKGLIASRYMPLRRQACARAERLEKQHAHNGTRLPNDNPSSGMHKLLASIKTPYDEDGS